MLLVWGHGRETALEVIAAGDALHGDAAEGRVLVERLGFGDDRRYGGLGWLRGQGNCELCCRCGEGLLRCVLLLTSSSHGQRDQIWIHVL